MAIEAWLRGPVPGIPGLLQPVAHALLQAREEVQALAPSIPAVHLWTRPHGAASIGFHLQHLCGVIDRLTTYARGETLSAAQMSALRAEGTDPDAMLTVPDLVDAFARQVDRALEQLAATPVETLLDPRYVGRAQLPSNVLGLLVHSAEHTTRHLGQLLVTARIAIGDESAAD